MEDSIREKYLTSLSTSLEMKPFIFHEYMREYKSSNIKDLFDISFKGFLELTTNEFNLLANFTEKVAAEEYINMAKLAGGGKK